MNVYSTGFSWQFFWKISTYFHFPIRIIEKGLDSKFFEAGISTAV